MIDINVILNNALEEACKLSGINNFKIRFRKSKYRDFQIDDIIYYSYLKNQNPLELANKIKVNLEKNRFFKNVLINSPGFICFDITLDFIMEALLSFEFTFPILNKTILIDYGGPNIAKDLHIGHLRSACLGISLTNLCQSYGMNTITDIHLGDYGYNMGLILAECENEKVDILESKEFISKKPQCLFRKYVKANENAKNNDKYKENARKISSQLVNNKHYYERWKIIREHSINYLKKIYDLIGIEYDYWYGESDSLDKVPYLLETLEKENLIQKRKGALAYKCDNGSFIIIKKTDGSYLYTTTEIATFLKRKEMFNLDEIWYVVDERQKQHFKLVFEIIKNSNLNKNSIKNEFIGFGTINDCEGKPLKSRNRQAISLYQVIKDLQDDINLYTSNIKHYLKNYDINMILELNIKFKILSVKRNNSIKFEYSDFSNMRGYCGFYIYKTKRLLKYHIEKNDLDLINFKSPNGNELLRKLGLKLLLYNTILQNTLETKSFHIFCLYLFELCKLINRVITESEKRYDGKHSNDIGDKMMIISYNIILHSFSIMNVK